MFLSQLILNPRSREVQRDLDDPYQMHKTLAHAFTSGLSDKDGQAALARARTLFRVDDDKSALHVIVQSRTAPQWDALPQSSYVLETPRVRPFDLADEVLRPGRHFVFRLLANPTKREKNSARRVGLYREWERLAWLSRKALSCGFGLEEQELRVRQSCTRNLASDDASEWIEMRLPVVQVADLNDGRRFPVLMSPQTVNMTTEPTTSSVDAARQKAASGKAQFSAARFDGVLQITDAVAFRAALENGIGSAKGFGFGLLSLAPLKR